VLYHTPSLRSPRPEPRWILVSSSPKQHRQPMRWSKYPQHQRTVKADHVIQLCEANHPHVTGRHIKPCSESHLSTRDLYIHVAPGVHYGLSTQCYITIRSAVTPNAHTSGHCETWVELQVLKIKQNGSGWEVARIKRQ
jgi:hypothetical protein